MDSVLAQYLTAYIMSESSEDWCSPNGLPRAAPDGLPLAAEVSDEDWGADSNADEQQHQPEQQQQQQQQQQLQLAMRDEEPAAAPVEQQGRRRMSRGEAAANARRQKGLREVALRQQAAEGSEQQAAEGSLFARALARCSVGSIKSFLKPAAAQAEEAQIPTSSFRDYIWSHGHSLFKLMQSNLCTLVESLLDRAAGAEEGAPGVVTPKVFLRLRKYDETGSILSSAWDHGQALLGDGHHLIDMEVGLTKVFVVELKCGMIFEKVNAAGGEAQTLSVDAACPALLQAVEKNSAECYLEALQRASRLPCDKLVEDSFSRQVDISIHDEHPSNGKCERAWLNLFPGRTTLELICDVHKKAAVCTKVFDVWKGLPTRIIRLAMSVRGAGMTLLRRTMREVIRDKLKINTGSPPASAIVHRNAMLALFASRGSTTDPSRRLILTSLFGGDWRVQGEIQYYDNGQIPGGRIAIERAFYVYGVRAVLPRAIRILARSNWTGTGMAFDDVGLALSIHGILEMTYLRLYPRVIARPPASQAARAARDAPGEAHGAGQAGDAEDWAEDADDTDGRHRDGDEQKNSEVWREEKQEQITSTSEWLASGSARDDLFIARTLHTPIEDLILDQLTVSGASWERSQQERYLRTTERSYQILIALDGKNTGDFLENLGDLMFRPSAWQHLERRTQSQQLFIFKLLARAGASAYSLLVVRQRAWPYKTFDILRHPSVTGPLLEATSDCQLDGYTAGFKEHYKGELTGVLARSELQHILYLAGTDAASTERLHSENQRRSKMKVWTHPTDLPTLSSWYVARCAFRQGADLQRQQAKEAPPSAQPRQRKRKRRQQQPSDAPRKQRRTGGGGAWRAFVHMKLKGAAFTAATMAEVSQEYRSLSPEAKAYWENLGKLGADLHQEGVASFGPRRRGE